jgi:predicted aldo/keto reductase-like oxidoreductase
MSKKETLNSRRAFLKTLGAAGSIGAGSILTSMTSLANASDKAAPEKNAPGTIPKRPYGKTGVNVSILALGGELAKTDQIVFRQAYKMGITYWDTADSYRWGGNEEAIGQYFKKYPDHRKDIFLVTKGATSDPEELTEKLNTSLQRMNTAYVDMYFIHYVKDVKEELTKEVRAWAEKAKADGKIRFFGFSAHKNMAASLVEASKLGWIDGIMMSYNYRLMANDEMKKAVDACAKAGIGLTAMKSQAAFTANFYASIGSESDDAVKMTDGFIKKGYTPEQARLKVIWENPHIASICSAMSNMTILQANAAAAMNKTELSSRDKQRLNQYAQQTACGYCAGCANICEKAVNFEVPISDILRYAMYKNSYGDHDRAKALFRALPEEAKENILSTDYSKAEKYCPQKIKISKVLKKTYEDLA